MSFSVDEEMRFQESCKGGRGQCRLSTDAVQLVNCSKSPGWKQQSSCDSATNGCGCPLHIEFAGGGRPQVSTSCEMNDRPADLSDIRGC